MLLACLASVASALVLTSHGCSPLMTRAPPPLLRHGTVAACEPATSTVGAPTAEQNAALADVKASPALQPREVISYMLNALHKSNLDKPKLHFGCEVALRFLAPTNPASKATPEKLAEYLGQTWYQPLLNWNEYRWEGDLTLLGENEAYQQVSTRVDANSPWVSVRWILVRVPFYGTTDQWMVNSVFVEEPDGSSTEMPLVAPSYRDLDSVENGLSAEQLLLLKEAAAETPSSIVLKVMHAVRKLDEPYPLHGCEVAIRYCSPSNRASRLSPQSFAQYLSEPWYQILTEWDQIELEECEELDEGSTQVSQDVLIKRDEDESWTLVNWQLSRHSGRWLMDELSIN